MQTLPAAITALLITTASTATASTVFKCTNAKTGAIEFTDEPCADNLQTEQIEVQPGTVVSSKQIYEDLERIEAEKAAVAKEQARNQKQQGDEPYADLHPAAGALNQIKTLIDTLRAPLNSD